MVPVPRLAVSPFKHLDRLPRGGDRDVGAGYVMAITAVGVTTFYYLVVGVGILLIGVGSGGAPFVTNAVVGRLFVVGLLSGAISLSAVVAPLLFVTGIAAWRLVPPSQRYGGAIGGLLAMALAYLVAGTVVVGLAPVYTVATGSSLLDTVIGGIGIIVVAFLASSWIALPASVLTGTLYERSLDE
ncbi:hypothetical protein [Halorubrum sp. CBA1229]|uniref:hypothetical protein n=1 Tax=Halorubrum sp. CBA1229 TaxID=1853699 RepID=UPI000F3D8919|nr:hypothetical protein [Halorubrum sp. CBA1229]QKY15960.1 hypothetical protein Hrr1229_003360 [Halorubrum sp. CBA1229]